MALSDPIATQIKCGIVEVIKGLDLAEIGTNVLSQLAKDEVNIKLPAVAVLGTGDPEQPLPGTTEHRDTQFPFPVLLLDREAATRTGRESVYRRWRDEILEAFEMKHREFPSVMGGTVFMIEVVPNLPISPEIPQYEMITSGLLLKVAVRRPRP